LNCRLAYAEPWEKSVIEKRFVGWLQRGLGGFTIRRSTRAETLNKKAMRAMSNNHLDRAEVLLLEAVKLEPDLAAAHHNLGALYLHQKRLPLALKHSRRAARLDPSDIETHIAIAQVQMEMGRRDKALEEYQRIQELFPQDWRSHVSLGNALLQMERVGDAREPLERAVELAPKEETAHLMLAMCREACGALEEALHEYRMVKKTTRLRQNRAAAEAKIKELERRLAGSESK
jgi:Flp pilus assembly protein TadD